MTAAKKQSKKRGSRNRRNQDEFAQQLVEVRRVSRMMAGGRRFSFRCFVVVGDRNGRVGIGIGKGQEVSTGVDKGVRRAKENMVEVPIVNDTIPFPVEAAEETARVLLKPASKGRGIIAGGVMRVICELAGIPNVTAKILGRTKNNINIARSTIKALQTLQNLAEIKGIQGDKNGENEDSNDNTTSEEESEESTQE